MRETAEKLADGMWLRRTWYDAHRIRSESIVSELNGAPSAAVWGPHREFDLDGRLVREVLIAAGRMVSLAEYEEARRADPRLPAPTVPPPSPEAYRLFRTAQQTDPRYVALRRGEIDTFCEERLKQGAPVALAALLDRGLPIIVGERSPRASAAIVQKLRAAPCKNVHAVEIEDVAPPGRPPALGVDQFVLELPDERNEREAVRRLVRPWVQSTGYELDEEIGQRFMFLRIK